MASEAKILQPIVDQVASVYRHAIVFFQTWKNIAIVGRLERTSPKG